MPSSPRDMRAAIARNMHERTGRSVDEWIALVRAQGLEGHGPVTSWLCSEHGLTPNYAGTIASLLRDEDVPPDELVERQYAGKEALKPILAAVRKAIPNGAVEEPRQTYLAAADVDGAVRRWLRTAFDRAAR